METVSLKYSLSCLHGTNRKGTAGVNGFLQQHPQEILSLVSRCRQLSPFGVRQLGIFLARRRRGVKAKGGLFPVRPKGEFGNDDKVTRLQLETA